MEKIILASGSSRRKDILKMCDIDFSVCVSSVDENISDKLAPKDIVIELSKRKALAVKNKVLNSKVPIIAADTIVSLNDEIFGKPKSFDDAFNTLCKLSGKAHQVYTGVTIVSDDVIDSFFECTEVTFNNLSKEEIVSYIKTGEPMDKAGSYGIQGKGAILIKKINGDYYNVVGLPISSVVHHLNKI